MKDRIMNTEKLISLVKAKADYYGQVYTDECLKRIEAAEKADPINRMRADIHFTKSRTTCDLWASSLETASATGYGYDRGSTALAKAAKGNPAIDRLLFDAIEGNEEDFTSVLGYGSGHGILPCLEAGVGLDCHFRILNRCGLVGKIMSVKGADIIILMTPEAWQQDFAIQLKTE